jgi:hypothetical protein
MELLRSICEKNLRWASWHKHCLQAERKTDSQEYKIIEYELNKSVAIEVQPPSVKLTMRFTLQPSHNDNGTVIVDEWKFDTGIPALFARIGVTNVKAAVAENLEKLKELLETGKTILQDGREERRG